jgi:hypothetical protein
MKVPTLKEMYFENISYLEYYLMLTSVVGVPIFLLLKLSIVVLIFLILMLLSTILFVFNMTRIMVK